MPDTSDTDPQLDGPREIAGNLLAEHGLEGAREISVEATAAAQRDKDNYSLSIWREIKRILREAEPKTTRS